MTHKLLPLLFALVACGDPSSATASPATTAASTDRTAAAPALEAGQAEAVFAGGCFWCMEKPFDKMKGVVSTTSGYIGGTIEGPTYKQVSSHATQHIEALRVVYDPTIVTYDALLSVFWHNIDPTQADGQFCDRGHQYTSAVFVGSPEERALAEASKAKAAATLGASVVTDIRDSAVFWEAEAYHQDFYKTNPSHYSRYRLGCGRDARLKQLWGDAAGH
ncbi:MAG: peptide-methionine (S)-S-oxide reductase [Myxococcota bacterium]|jgi:peptide-methionine (S)-S-oxide reductase